MSVTAKSVILDIADNWGGANYMGLMSVDFWLNGSKIALLAADFTSYATSELSASYHAENVFDTSLPKITGYSGKAWFSASGGTTNQRLICVFDTVQTFDEIRINNLHNSGTQTNYGAKNTVISISPDIETDTKYASTSANMSTVFSGVLDEHVADNIEDEQVLALIGAAIITSNGGAVAGGAAPVLLGYAPSAVTVKSVIIDIADNWGDFTYLSLRSADFYLSGAKINLLSADFTSYATSKYSFDYHAENVFDTSLSKTGTPLNTSWSSATWAKTNQRIICVFDVAQTFDEIHINNFHDIGAGVTRGAKNIRISTSAATVTDTTYAATSIGQSVFFEGILDIHVASDVEDAQVFTRAPLSASISGSSGAVAGGTSGVQTSPLTVTGTGGAVAGGDTTFTAVNVVPGNIIQRMAQVTGLAYTDQIGNGNVVVPEVNLTSAATTLIQCSGEIYGTRVKLKADTGSAGKITATSPSLSSIAVNSIRASGNLTTNGHAISANTGSTGDIFQPGTIVASAGINTIQASCDLVASLPEISGVSLTHSLGQGRFVQKSPAITAGIGHKGDFATALPAVSGLAETVIIGRGALESPRMVLSGFSLGGSVGTGEITVNGAMILSVATSDGYAHGDIVPPSPSIFGTAYTSAMVAGSITPIHPSIYGQTELGATSDIIRYHRGCSAA